MEEKEEDNKKQKVDKYTGHEEWTMICRDVEPAFVPSDQITDEVREWFKTGNLEAIRDWEEGLTVLVRAPDNQNELNRLEMPFIIKSVLYVTIAM